MKIILSKIIPLIVLLINQYNIMPQTSAKLQQKAAGYSLAAANAAIRENKVSQTKKNNVTQTKKK